MTFDFYVAELRFRMNVQEEIAIPVPFKPFFFPADFTKPADLEVTYSGVDQVPVYASDQSSSKNQYWYRDMECLTSPLDETVLFHTSKDQPAYARTVWPNHKTEKIEIPYRKDTTVEVQSAKNLYDLMVFPDALLQFDGFVLHASFVCLNKKAILFSGPSGIGKSTQADHWVREFGARILNGDRVIIRYTDKGWMCYGLPVAGTSDIFINEGAPLACIILLKQGSDNIVSELKKTMKISMLYRQTALRPWNPWYTDRLLDLETRLVSQIPVFEYSCLPDSSAAYDLRQYLERRGII